MAIHATEWYTVECLQIPVRRAPSTDSEQLTVVRLGDEVQAVAARPRSVGAQRWLRASRQSLVDRLDGRGPVHLGLSCDGFLLMEDPELGELLLPRHHWELFEVQAPGHLSRAEMQRRARPGAPWPLEARLLTLAPAPGRPPRYGGEAMPRPRTGAGAPAAAGSAGACAAAGTGGPVPVPAPALSEEALEGALGRAARWLAGAEALLVASGECAGSAATAHGTHAWPGLRERGLEFEEACSADWFKRDPGLGWAFWNFCHESSHAHPAFEAMRSLSKSARRTRHGACLITSAWDGSWKAAGWEGKLVELHGSLHWWQCSQPESCKLGVWAASGESGLSQGTGEGPQNVPGSFPMCPTCGAAARPNVQMYHGDYAFSKRRFRAQMGAYNEWIRSLESTDRSGDLQLVCLEVECGLAVPTLRREVESVMRQFPSARLIRISTESIDVLKSLAERSVALPFSAEAGLGAIQARQYKCWQASMATFVLWDEEGGGTEVLHERGASVRSVLAAAGLGAAAAAAAEARAVAVSQDMGKGRRLDPDHRVPPWYFFEDPRPGPAGAWRAPGTAVLALPGGALPPLAASAALQLRVREAHALLADADLAGRLAGAPGGAPVPALSRGAAGSRALALLASSAGATALRRHGLPPGERGLAALECLLGAACSAEELRAAGLPPRPVPQERELGMRLRHDDWELSPPGGPHFGIVGTWDDWREVHDMLWDGTCYGFYIQLGAKGWESFQILKDGSWDHILFPDCRDGSPHVPHKICGPRKDGGHGKNWSIGLHKNDVAVPNARYAVRLQLNEAWEPKRVEWTKLDSTVPSEAKDAMERGFFQAGSGAVTRHT